MTGWIVGAVLGGIAAGYLFIPQALAEHCGTLITVGLCLILFLVGVDMGRQGNVWRDIKAAGFKVLLIPVATAAGTLGFAALGSLLLPLTVRETMAASAGFGWYSLAPMLLSSWSATLSAVAVLSNVLREVGSAMDTVLPVVVGSTHERITIYSFVSGVILSFAVPVLVPLIMTI